MLPNYINDIIANMVRQHYFVQAGLDSGLCISNNSVCLLVIFAATKNETEHNVDKVVKDFKNSLSVSGAKYYAASVNVHSPGTYFTGNIVIPKEVSPTQIVKE